MTPDEVKDALGKAEANLEPGDILLFCTDHSENLNNLAQVAGRRFEFYGFPLKLEVAYGSPVRAVGIVED